MAEAEPIGFDSTGLKKKERRPWGSIDVLANGPGFRTRRLTISPLKRLSLHWHRHRDEHWVVARGTARISVDGVERTLGTGQSIDVPRTVEHRAENISSIDPLEIVEVQTGDYLGDDDIVRVVDDFGQTD